MAQFDYYCIWEDSLAFLQDLINTKRFTFIVNMFYPKDEICQFTSLNEDVLVIIQQRKSLYLWSSEYSSYPPRLKQIPTGFWCMDVWGCGPYLELAMPHGKENEGIMALGFGILGYQPYFCYPETYNAYKPPEMLKQAYKDVRKILRKRMGKRYVQFWVYNRKIDELQTRIFPYWIGLNALKLIEEGKAGIKGHYRWFTKSLLAKTREEVEALYNL